MLLKGGDVWPGAFSVAMSSLLDLPTCKEHFYSPNVAVFAEAFGESVCLGNRLASLR